MIVSFFLARNKVVDANAILSSIRNRGRKKPKRVEKEQKKIKLYKSYIIY